MLDELEAAAVPDVAVMAEAVAETAFLIASWKMLCKPAICIGVRVPSASCFVSRDLDLLRECRVRFLERSLLFERERFRDFFDLVLLVVMVTSSEFIIIPVTP